MTLRNIGFRTTVAGAVDFVISRQVELSASLVRRFPAMRLQAANEPTGGSGGSNSSSSGGSNVTSSSSSGSGGDSEASCGPIYVQLHSAYFQSAGGLLILGLSEGDMITGSLWDGNAEIVDSDRAVVLAAFMSGAGSGVVVGRREPADAYAQRPCVRARPQVPFAGIAPPGTPGMTGAHVMVASASPYDLVLLNSSSFAVADFYTETGHGSTRCEGDGVSPPGIAMLSYAKLNSNGPGTPAHSIANYAGSIVVAGALSAYGNYNTTVDGPGTGIRSSPVSIALVSSVIWTQPIAVAVPDSAGASTSITLLGNVGMGGPTPLPDAVTAESNATLAAGIDRLRLLGVWDTYIHFPWLMPPLPSASATASVSATATATSSRTASYTASASTSSTAAATPTTSSSSTATLTATPSASTTAAATPASSGSSSSSASVLPSSSRSVQPLAASASPSPFASPSTQAGASAPVAGGITGEGGIGFNIANGTVSSSLAAGSAASSAAAAVGIVAGVIAGVAVLAALAVFLLRRQRRRRTPASLSKSIQWVKPGQARAAAYTCGGGFPEGLPHTRNPLVPAQRSAFSPVAHM